MYIKISDTVSPDDCPPSPQYTPPPPSPRTHEPEPMKIKTPFKNKLIIGRYQKYIYLFIDNSKMIYRLILSFMIGFTISFFV